MEVSASKRFTYRFGKFVLDPREKTLFADGRPLHLPAKEFETLLLLVENSGKALTKEEIMSAVWRDAFVEEGNLAKQISRLRKILNAGGGGGERFIETLPKHGYRFSAEVSQIVEPIAAEAEETILEKRSLKRLTVRVEEDLSPPPPPPQFLSPAARKISWRVVSVILGMTILSFGFMLWYRGKPPSATDDPAKINSMAVLPLLHLGEGENNKSLGLGLADALIMKIGGLRQIVVRPLSAVASYAEAPPSPLLPPPEDALEIGKKLKVDAVLEGTIRQLDGRVRVNVRLLRVANGEQIWAANFEDESAKIFDLEQRLSEQTAQALKLKLGASENERITKRFTNNAAALDAYQKGRYFWNRRTAGDLRAAVGYFNEAIRIDPNYALAYAGLADAYSLLADYNGAPPDEAYPRAKEAAMKALELDVNLAEAHTSLAYVKMSYDRDWPAAEDGYRRAIALNPNYASAHQWYAEYLTAMGRFDEALAETGRAKEIDPLSPIVNAGEVWTLYFARRFDEAIARGREIAGLNPQFAEIHEYLKRCYDQKEMYAEAVAARQTRRLLVGLDATVTAVLKDAAAAKKSGDYWKKRLAQEIEEARGEAPEFFNLAEIYARLGEKDLAFEQLDKAIENRDYEVIYLRVAPNLDPLRADPRFADALRRAGHLPP
jgi:DNA-binding winged helix-turn-helix (wHTH) protein/TolB-like protein